MTIKILQEYVYLVLGFCAIGVSWDAIRGTWILWRANRLESPFTIYLGMAFTWVGMSMRRGYFFLYLAQDDIMILVTKGNFTFGIPKVPLVSWVVIVSVLLSVVGAILHKKTLNNNWVEWLAFSLVMSLGSIILLYI